MSNDPSASEDFAIEAAGSEVELEKVPLPEFLLQRDEPFRSEYSSASQLQGLIGDRSGRRLWANECDFLLAVIVSMMSVISLPDFDPMWKGLSFYLFYLLYYQITEYMGATPAKWWFGLCVRSIDGSRATFGQIAIRTIFRVIETNPIFLGFFPAAFLILFTKRHVRLGDWLAGTVVVRVEDLG